MVYAKVHPVRLAAGKGVLCLPEVGRQVLGLFHEAISCAARRVCIISLYLGEVVEGALLYRGPEFSPLAEVLVDDLVAGPRLFKELIIVTAARRRVDPREVQTGVALYLRQDFIYLGPVLGAHLGDLLQDGGLDALVNGSSMVQLPFGTAVSITVVPIVNVSLTACVRDYVQAGRVINSFVHGLGFEAVGAASLRPLDSCHVKDVDDKI